MATGNLLTSLQRSIQYTPAYKSVNVHQYTSCINRNTSIQGCIMSRSVEPLKDVTTLARYLTKLYMSAHRHRALLYPINNLLPAYRNKYVISKYV